MNRLFKMEHIYFNCISSWKKQVNVSLSVHEELSRNSSQSNFGCNASYHVEIAARNAEFLAKA